MMENFDWMLVRNIASWILFLVGGLGVVVGALGIVRFPDFFTRLHAAGITDTAGAELIVIGMMLQAPNWLVVVKLGFIAAFLALTSPGGDTCHRPCGLDDGFSPDGRR